MSPSHETSEQFASSLPPLLEAFPRWHPGGWALPAQTISFGAWFVFLAALIYLERSVLVRSLFRLPFRPIYLAAPAAALAWVIGAICARRPGRNLPRWLALFLSLSATAIAMWAVVDPWFVPRGRPLVHVLTIASAMAVAVQSVRLVRIRPSSWLVQQISLMAVALVLLVGLPSIYFVESKVVRDEQDLVSARIEELSRLAEHVRQITTFQWKRAADDLAEAQRRLDAISRVEIPLWITDNYLWRAADLLGRSDELRKSTETLIEVVSEATDRAEGPRLTVPQHRYNLLAHQWEMYPSFPTLAHITVGYYRVMSTLHAQARDRVALLDESRATRSVKAHFVPTQLEASPPNSSATDWETGWLAPILTPASSPSPASLSVNLRRRLATQSGTSISGAHIADLLVMTKQAAESLGSGPCRASSYKEESYAYFRVDCDAYTLTENSTSAQLLAEVRLVYRRPAGSKVQRNDLPHSLFYMFPVPHGTDLAAYQQQVMQELNDAVLAVYGPVTTTRRGGPPTDGFTASIGGRIFEVTKPQGVRGFNAVETQVYRR